MPYGSSNKVLIEEYEKHYEENIEIRRMYKCPNCSNVLFADRYQRTAEVLLEDDETNFCKVCGTKLDWSEVIESEKVHIGGKIPLKTREYGEENENE